MTSSTQPTDLNLNLPIPAPRIRESFLQRFVAKYKADHTNPINNAIHLGYGWPAVGASLFLWPFFLEIAAVLFVTGWGAMFAGHYFFEKNAPTIFTKPATPFLMLAAILGGIFTKGLKYRPPIGITKKSS
jgi:hypothetical protein